MIGSLYIAAQYYLTALGTKAFRLHGCCAVLNNILSCRLNEDCNSIQNAISEKVGNTLHHIATFVVGIAIGLPLCPSCSAELPMHAFRCPHHTGWCM